MKSELPSNIHAERSVIGSVLIDQSAYVELAQFLKEDDFFHPANRWVWLAFVNLQNKQMPIDYLTTSAELESMKLLGDVGGEGYLTDLITLTPSSSNAVAYGKVVKDLSIRRGLIAASGSIATEAYNNLSIPIEELVANSMSKIQIASTLEKTERRSLKQLVDEHKNIIEGLAKNTKINPGIMFRLPDVDKKLGYGLQKKFMILAGRPGIGKTSLAIQVALEAIKDGKTAVVFSLEMDSEQITNVMMSMVSGLDSQILAAGRLSQEEWEQYYKAENYLKSMAHRLIVFTNPAESVQTIRARCLAVKAVGSLDLVVIDYLMRIGGYSRLDANDRANMLTADIATLKSELKCALILIHHMNRGIEHRGGEPILSDLNEGGERDPDIVAFLHIDKDAINNKGLTPVKMTFAKHRGGPQGTVDLLFKGSCTTFLSAASKYINLNEHTQEGG